MGEQSFLSRIFRRQETEEGAGKKERGRSRWAETSKWLKRSAAVVVGAFLLSGTESNVPKQTESSLDTHPAADMHEGLSQQPVAEIKAPKPVEIDVAGPAETVETPTKTTYNFVADSGNGVEHYANEAVERFLSNLGDPDLVDKNAKALAAGKLALQWIEENMPGQTYKTARINKDQLLTFQAEDIERLLTGQTERPLVASVQPERSPADDLSIDPSSADTKVWGSLKDPDIKARVSMAVEEPSPWGPLPEKPADSDDQHVWDTHDESAAAATTADSGEPEQTPDDQVTIRVESPGQVEKYIIEEALATLEKRVFTPSQPQIQLLQKLYENPSLMFYVAEEVIGDDELGDTFSFNPAQINEALRQAAQVDQARLDNITKNLSPEETARLEYIKSDLKNALTQIKVADHIVMHPEDFLRETVNLEKFRETTEDLARQLPVNFTEKNINAILAARVFGRGKTFRSPAMDRGYLDGSVADVGLKGPTER